MHLISYIILLGSRMVSVHILDRQLRPLFPRNGMSLFKCMSNKKYLTKVEMYTAQTLILKIQREQSSQLWYPVFIKSGLVFLV